MKRARLISEAINPLNLIEEAVLDRLFEFA